MIGLRQLIAGLSGVHCSGAADPQIGGIAVDSRRVEPGTLFAALPGLKTDGRLFIRQALDRGAAAVLLPTPPPADAPDVPLLVAEAPRRVLAQLCRRFFGAPDEDLALVGVTGTNGKTTTTQMIAAAFAAHGKIAGTGGTLGQQVAGLTIPGTLTTPEAPDLWSFLAEARRAHASMVAIEVSSAALIADRTQGMQFAGAVLTGIGRDHLDVHGTLEDYIAAKRLLFRDLPAQAVAVLPADDPWSDSFRAVTAAPVVTFGETAAADWRISHHQPAVDGARFHLEGPGFSGEIRTTRPGPWDARNIAAAVALAARLGVPAATAVAGAAGLAAVDGRWERVPTDGSFAALVDYAHTPEALERTLAMLRRVTSGRVILVFGCGGDRDRGKRPEMGRVAGRFADIVLVTEDNPRSEDPETIAREILAGLAGSPAQVERIAGRAAAIRRAVEWARRGDAVLVSGKGHETYQEIAGTRHPFDDREHLRAALIAREAGR